MDVVTEGGGRGIAAAAVDAALPPDWWTRLPAVRQKLEQQVKSAADQGAFAFGSTFSGTKHALYIRPIGLFHKVKEKLSQVVDARKTAGVLIWGSKGMGKTSLAKDIAFEFAFTSGAAALFVANCGIPGHGQLILRWWCWCAFAF